MADFMMLLLATLACIYFIYAVVGWVLGCDPLPIWFHKYFLGKKVYLVKDQYSSPFKVVVRKDPFDGNEYGYRYHHTKVGIVTFYEDGSAEYCGKARWKIA